MHTCKNIVMLASLVSATILKKGMKFCLNRLEKHLLYMLHGFLLKGFHRIRS